MANYSDENQNVLLDNILDDLSTPDFEDEIKDLAENFWQFKSLWEQIPGLFDKAIGDFHKTITWSRDAPAEWSSTLR